ncbi:MAG: hypothetical protein HY735_08850 [Verrucomicrobia bacterium]|nr:hypothetical protein [Verrucomicrobiota bacterium]
MRFLKTLGLGALWVLPGLSFAQTSFSPQGGEYPNSGLLAGDQVLADVAVSETGGYVVWQDNATDGDGFGISARRLAGNLLGTLSVFRVNEAGGGDQQHPKVRRLANEGAVFVWQGGALGDQDVFARFIGPDGTFVTSDQRVNSFTENQQINPALAVLSDGSVLVTWSSFGQDGSMQGIFGQRLSPSGSRLGGEFQVNQYTRYNQRTPSIASLPGGQFVIAWISEQKRFENSIDVYGRVFTSDGTASSDEFHINTATNICANPVVSALPDGGFMIGWSEREIANRTNGWDVFVRSFRAGLQPTGGAQKVNVHANGNHYAPQIAGNGDTQLVVWTSAGQDGSFEGVFGRFVKADGTSSGAEFQVNGTSVGPQIYPAVAADGNSQFLVTWSSFIGGPASFDLFARRYAYSASRPAVPFVSALSSTRLSVTWPEAGTDTVNGYELYVDDRPVPELVTGNIWTLNSLAPGSSHSFKLAYRFKDGSRSMLSAPAVGLTWGSDENLDGLPDDWQTAHWGNDPRKWPDPKADSDSDGSSNLHEFLAGTSPVDPKSVLRTEIVSTAQGSFLNWNTRPGSVYQVQRATALPNETDTNPVEEAWADVGTPRFAPGSTDSMLVHQVGNSVFYRVKRLR